MSDVRAIRVFSASPRDWAMERRGVAVGWKSLSNSRSAVTDQRLAIAGGRSLASLPASDGPPVISARSIGPKTD